MQRQISPAQPFSCIAPTLAPVLAALSVTRNIRKWKPLPRHDVEMDATAQYLLSVELWVEAVCTNHFQVVWNEWQGDWTRTRSLCPDSTNGSIEWYERSIVAAGWKRD